MDIISITSYAITFPNGQFVQGESVAVMTVVKEDTRLYIEFNKLYLVSDGLLRVAFPRTDTLFRTQTHFWKHWGPRPRK